MELTPSERAELAAILSRAGCADRVSIDMLLSKWASVVRQCERGYEDNIDEYANDLACRESLDEIITAASGALADKLRCAVADLDQRFERATEEVGKPFLAVEPATAIEKMLYLRVPKKRSGELEEDLHRLGLSAP